MEREFLPDSRLPEPLFPICKMGLIIHLLSLPRVFDEIIAQRHILFHSTTIWGPHDVPGPEPGAQQVLN